MRISSWSAPRYTAFQTRRNVMLVIWTSAGQVLSDLATKTPKPLATLSDPAFRPLSLNNPRPKLFVNLSLSRKLTSELLGLWPYPCRFIFQHEPCITSPDHIFCSIARKMLTKYIAEPQPNTHGSPWLTSLTFSTQRLL